MRKTLILLCAILALIAVVSCKQDVVDPYIYEYDPTSLLGAWEMDFAKADGDEDGCIHLLQINFEKDLTYSCVEYFFDAVSNNIKVQDADTGVYAYDPDSGEISLDGNPAELIWTEEEGLSFYRLAKRYDFSRPKYVIKVSQDQAALEGVWEKRLDEEMVGLNREQFVFNSDGTADILSETGVSNPSQYVCNKSWQYKDGDDVKDYQITRSMKWYQGSEMEYAGDSTLTEPIHKQQNYFVFEKIRSINNNGVTTITTERIVYHYLILEYGNERLLVNRDNGLTYVKKNQSEIIDVSKKVGLFVRDWEIFSGEPQRMDPPVAPTDSHTKLYLRSDGTFFTDGTILNITEGYPTVNSYYGAYSTDLTEIDLGAFLDTMKIQWMEYDPVKYNDEFDWAAWRESETAYFIDNETYTYKFYKGTLTLDPEYGGAKKYEVLLLKASTIYGFEAPDGQPGDFYMLLFKRFTNNYRWLLSVD